MAEPTSHPIPPTEPRKPIEPWRRLDPSEVPPELADDPLIQYLMTMTPEDEAVHARCAELAALDP